MGLVESIANAPSFHVEMNFESGDIQFLNNARVLHAREAFDDSDDPAERRHLLRLWLRAPRVREPRGAAPRRDTATGPRKLTTVSW